MTLTDALAAALDDWLSWEQAEDGSSTPHDAAEHILADPAFREALTDAVINALSDANIEEWGEGPLAEFIVDRLLPVEEVGTDGKR